MRRAVGYIIVSLWLISIASVSGQTLSTEVFASEDEVYEAFLQGDLRYHEYLALIELIVHGVGPHNWYLLDEIPNSVFIDSTVQESLTPLKLEQQAEFVDQPKRASDHGLTFTYRYFRGLEDQASSGYRLGTRFDLNQHWRGSARLHREYSEAERVVSRWVEYSNPEKGIKAITIGSFNSRLGLGTVYGRRGNLFDFSRDIDGESFLFPDYGGFNGLNGRFQSGDLEVELLGTVTRDTQHRLSSVGGMARHPFGEWEAGLIFGHGRLANRTTGSSLSDQKVALNLSRKSRFGSIGVELTRQFGDGGPSGALLVEGKRVLVDATVKLAGWVYGKDFVNLTSGSKAASLSRTVTDSLTGFKYTDRLSGQRGGLLQTRLKIQESWELTSSVIVGQREFDSSRVEFMGSLRRIWSPAFSVRADFLSRSTKRGPGSDNIRLDQRTRVEMRLNFGETETRSYIAYQKVASGTDHWSLFARVSTYLSGLGEIELWTNVGRITRDGIQYWYAYLKQIQPLSKKTALTIKLSNSYDRVRLKRHDTALSLEVVTSL